MEPRFVTSNAGIVSRRDNGTAKRIAPLTQLTKLDLTVAVNTWIRCTAACVRIDELVDDLTLKGSLEIKDIVRNAYSRGDLPGIREVFRGAAGGSAATSAMPAIIPHLHR